MKTAVPGCVLCHHPFHNLSLSGRTSIHKTNLPVFVGLRQNRIQHFAKILLRSLIGRYHHRKKRLRRKRCFSLTFQLLLCRFGQIVPLAVIIIIVQALKLMLGL